MDRSATLHESGDHTAVTLEISQLYPTDAADLWDAVTSAEAGADAWGASAQARRFMTGSSRRWVAAAVAAGTPTEAAEAAGGRTTAFYTGQPG